MDGPQNRVFSTAKKHSKTKVTPSGRFDVTSEYYNVSNRTFTSRISFLCYMLKHHHANLEEERIHFMISTQFASAYLSFDEHSSFSHDFEANFEEYFILAGCIMRVLGSGEAKFSYSKRHYAGIASSLKSRALDTKNL